MFVGRAADMLNWVQVFCNMIDTKETKLKEDVAQRHNQDVER